MESWIPEKVSVLRTICYSQPVKCQFYNLITGSAHEVSFPPTSIIGSAMESWIPEKVSVPQNHNYSASPKDSCISERISFKITSVTSSSYIRLVTSIAEWSYIIKTGRLDEFLKHTSSGMVHS